MKSDRLDLTVDMIISMAIDDMANEDGISVEEARDKLMSSNAVEVLYDSDNGIWADGPDALRELYKEIG